VDKNVETDPDHGHERYLYLEELKEIVEISKT
jgi:hypothetical protein